MAEWGAPGTKYPGGGNAGFDELYNPDWWVAESLIWLQKNLISSNLIWRGPAGAATAYGDQVQFHRPHIPTVQESTTGITTTTPTNWEKKADAITLDVKTYDYVRILITDWDKQRSFTDIFEEHIQPSLYALADKVDFNILNALAESAVAGSNYSAGQGTSGAFDFKDLTMADRMLSEAKVPTAPRYGIMGPRAKQELFDSKPEIMQSWSASKQGDQALKRGELGTYHSINWFMSQQMPACWSSLHSLNVSFHPQAACFVMRPIVTPPPGTGAKVSSGSYKGLSIRTSMAYSESLNTLYAKVDCLYGVEIMNASMIYGILTPDTLQ